MQSIIVENYIKLLFWLAFFGLLHIGTISSTNFTVIYDQFFDQQLINNALQKSDSRVNFLKIDEQFDNLQNITTNLKNIIKYDVVILFTKEDDFIERTLGNQQLVLKYGVSLANMMERNARMQNSFCLTFNQSLQKTLTMLTYSLFQPKVAIVTNEENCAKDFFKSLETSVLNSQHRDLLHVKMEHVLYSKNQPPYQKNLQDNNLHALKSLDKRLIILLVPDQYVPIVLKEAARLGVLERTSIWLIPSYHNDMASLSFYPDKLLSFEIEENKFITSPYKSLKRSVTDAIKVYESMKNFTSRGEISIQMFQTVQRIEEEQHTDKLRLNFRYRDNGIKTQKSWSHVVGEIDQDWFYLYENTIPVLQPIIDEHTDEDITAVILLDEPYAVDRMVMYDSIHDTCTIGMKCMKPVKNNGTVSYEATCCTGFVIDLFMLIIRQVGVNVHMYAVEDNNYGTKGNDGKWNGMIGDLLAGKADMAVAGLTITESRSNFIDFTLPFLEAEMGIIVKPQVIHLDFINFEFLSPLSGKLQLMLWLIIVGTIALNYGFENSIYLTSLTNKHYTQESYYSTYESMTYISGVALQRDLGGKNPKRPGARFSAIAFAFGMVIVVTTYTAVLAAQNVQYVEENPFKGSKDSRMRNPTSNFRFGTRRNTSYVSYFNNSEIDFVQRIYKFMEQYNVDTTEEGVRRVKNGELEAFVGDYELLHWYIGNDRSCELRVQKDTLLHPGGYGFGMKKDFKWSTKINEAVLQYRESNELLKLYKKWFTNVCEVTSTTPKMVQLDINHFGGLIFMLCVTALICFPMLLPEHLYDRYFKNIVEKQIKRIFKMQSYQVNEEMGGRTPKYEVDRFFEELQKNSVESYQDIIRKREDAMAKFND